VYKHYTGGQAKDDVMATISMRRILPLLLLVELFSVFAYLLPSFNTAAFFILSALTLGVTLVRLEYGIWILFAELFIGSKGFLFYLDFDGTIVSIRIALWLIVLSVYLTQLVMGGWRTAYDEWRTIPSLRWYAALAVIVLLGVVQGLVGETPMQDVFLDMNGWLFFLLLFPIMHVMRTREQIMHIKTLLIACALWLSAKALFLLFIFAHDPVRGVYLPLYRWVRTSGVGELTEMSATFIRVFFQSQLYVLIAFFILIAGRAQAYGGVVRWRVWSMRALLFSSILLSFSRSFWLGLIAGLCALLFVRQWRAIPRTIGAALLATVVIVAVMYVPIPRFGGGGSGFGGLIQERISTSNEAAVSSRWSLLPVLWQEVRATPIFGQGFGASVTYTSDDPRIVNTSAAGSNDYTTYAFEWGYLDVWLKLGLLGVVAYLGLLASLLLQLARLKGERSALAWPLFAGAVTNVFSPYLNHPLGIGYLLIVTAYLGMKSNPQA
jgi:hypothetical protein